MPEVEGEPESDRYTVDNDGFLGNGVYGEDNVGRNTVAFNLLANVSKDAQPSAYES